jgi:hypothetical protein
VKTTRLRAKVSSALSGTSTDFSNGTRTPPSDVERITDELIQFTRPERVEFSPQGRHALRFEAVVLEPSLSSAGHQPCLG